MRSRTIVTAAVAGIGALLLLAPSITATAAPFMAATPVIVAAEDPAPLPPPVMGEYDPDDYEDAAADLPDGLVDALADEGLSGAEYLAQADAAAVAGDVIAALDAQIDVLGSRLDGTELIVNVASDAEASVVAAAGALAEVGPAPEPTVEPTAPELMQDLTGGEAFYYETAGGAGHRCSIGFNGFAISTHAQQFATAGHCNSGNSNYYFWLQQAQAGSTGYTLYADAQIGRRISASFKLGTGHDFGLVNVDSDQAFGWTPQPTTEYWGGSLGGNKWGGTAVTDRIPAVVGATLCKSGSTTGWTCGQVLEVDVPVNVQGSVINSIITSTCIQSGDSGGSGLIGSAAVAIVSWAETAVPCGNADYSSGLFPLVSTNPSATTGLTASPNWEPYVSLGNVIVTSPAGSVAGNSISGILGLGGARHVVDIYVDGSGTAVTVPVGSDGSWTFSTLGLALGNHSIRLVPRWGTWSVGPQLIKAFTLVGGEIRGNVDDHLGANLVGACVDAVSGGVVRDSVTTDGSGNYVLDGLAAGDYLVHFRDCTADAVTFEDEWWNNADNASVATATTVAFSQTVNGRNAQLAIAGPFADVRNNHPFRDPINWMYSDGLSNGYLDGGVRTFHPLEDVSRQAMAAFLYRYSGSPSFPLPAEPTFADVPVSHPFYTEIEWMKFAGISNGNVGPGDTLVFLPLDPVSRQAMSAFLYRLAGNPEFEPPATPTFADVGTGHPFFLQIEWMKANGITNGNVGPGGTVVYLTVDSVSRQAMAAFLSRYDGID